MRDSDGTEGAGRDPIGTLLAALEQARADGSMEALVLADTQGLVVAGAGAFWLCEELAAAAPFLGTPTHPANDVVPNSVEALERTRMVRIQVDGVELLMCGRGGSGETGLLAAARSARRLLDTRRAARHSSAPNSGALVGELDSGPAP